MTRRPRRNHTATFKAKVALAALKGDKTLRSCRSSSTSTPTRSRTGRRGCRKVPIGVFGETRPRSKSRSM